MNNTAREKLLASAPALLAWQLALLLGVFNSGCRAVQTAVDVPEKTVRAVQGHKDKDKDEPDPVAVEQALLRFSDELFSRTIIGLGTLRRGTNALPPAELLQWKIALGTEITTMASGPNAVANLLNLTIFVTETRQGLEQHWLPKIFGESALPLVETYRTAEAQIWHLASTVLKPEQQAELHKSIDAWHARNPLPENVPTVRSLGFAAEVAQTNPEAGKVGSVFSLLNIDPLSALDPAMHEIAETRLFGERALFVTQKMPLLVRWQTELLLVNTTDIPAVQQLVTNSTQATSSLERFASVAEKFPGQFSIERQEIVKAFESQEKGLLPLMQEFHQSIAAGTQLSTSLNTTLTTFDAVMKRFGAGDTNPPPVTSTNPAPFRIQDYTESAARFEAAARQFTELLVTLDHTVGSTNLARLTAETQTGGKGLVNYIFWKSVLFLAIALLGMLIYRFLTSRMEPKPRSAE